MELFHNFFRNLTDCYRRFNWIWHVLAIVLTYICIISGLDWQYYLATQKLILRSVMFPAVILGSLLPILGPLFLLFWGKIKKDLRLINTAWMLGQTGLIALFVSYAYKAVTGRAHPEFNSILNTDITGIFNFGFLRGGIFWGWPSSHTIVAFAMAAGLVAIYPKNKKLSVLAFMYALYIGLGVSVTIHWFSDFLAGAVIGFIVGGIVGRDFRKRFNFR